MGLKRRTNETSSRNRGFREDEIIWLDDELEETEETDTEDAGPKKAQKSEQQSDQKNDQQTKQKTKRKKSSGVSVVKPVAAVGKTTGRAVTKLISLLFKLGSFLMMGVIVGKLSIEFWGNRNVLGNMMQVAAEKNYTEALYLGIAAVLLLYGIISALWMLTGRKMAEDGNVRSFDTGRGVTAFVIFGVAAFVSIQAAGMIPGSSQVLEGARLALQTIGNVRQIILPCAAAGIVFCIIRKVIKK